MEGYASFKDIFEDCLDELLQKLNCPICYDCGDRYNCDECDEKVCVDCIHFIGSDVHDHNLCENCYKQQAW